MKRTALAMMCLALGASYEREDRARAVALMTLRESNRGSRPVPRQDRGGAQRKKARRRSGLRGRR
jgi:hypothetical protein